MQTAGLKLIWTSPLSNNISEKNLSSNVLMFHGSSFEPN